MVVPVIAPGVAGVGLLTVTARLAAPLVPQVLVAVTVMLPVPALAAVVIVIEVVPWPAVIVPTEGGTVHVYDVALPIATIL